MTCHTENSTKRAPSPIARAMCLFFFATIGIVPLWERIDSAMDRQPPRTSERISLLQFLDAAKIKTFEDHLEKSSALRAEVLPPFQHLLTAVLGAGNEQVYPGRSGWLFYRADIDHLTSGIRLSPEEKHRGQPLETILDFHRQLRARNIDLIAMPTPVKPQVHPEKMSSHYDQNTSPIYNPAYIAFKRTLADQGVHVFDPTDILFSLKTASDRSAYLKTDTHWTPQAIDSVAACLARAIRTNFDLPHSAQPFVRRSRIVENLGDIARMLHLPASQAVYQKEIAVIHPVEHAIENSAPILLLGDSFSNIYSLSGMGWGENAGFAEQLAYHLQMPIDRIAINAGGAYSTRKALQQDLLRGRDRLAEKRLAVWQFATRELTEGHWEILPLPEAIATPNSPEANADFRRVRAIVRDRTLPPAPGSVPYSECIISLLLTDVQVIEGAPLSDDMIAFVWGMRNGEWTPHAALQLGDRIVLDLRAWSGVESLYGGYNRKELQGENAFLLDVFWGTAIRGEIR